MLQLEYALEKILIYQINYKPAINHEGIFLDFQPHLRF